MSVLVGGHGINLHIALDVRIKKSQKNKILENLGDLELMSPYFMQK